MTRWRRWAGWSAFDASPTMLAGLAVSVLGVAVIGAFAVAELGLLEDRYAVTAVFDDSGGLEAGANVRMAGIDVGTVTAVQPDFTRGQVVVAFGVDRGVDLGPQTRAEIAPNTVLGGFHVRLSGPVEPPLLATVPRSDRRIPLARTASSYTVVDALETTTDTVGALDLDTANAVIDQMGRIIEDTHPDFNQLVERTTDLAAIVNARRDELSDLLDQGARLTATLRSRDEEVLALADVATRVVDRLVARRDEIRRLLRDGSHTVDQVADLLADTRAEVQAIIDDLDATLALTERRTDELDRSLTLLPSTLRELAEAGDGGDWLTLLGDELVLVPEVR